MDNYSTKVLKGKYLIALSIVLFIQTSNSSYFGQIMAFFYKDSFSYDCPEEYKKKDDKDLCDLKKMCHDGLDIHLDKQSLKNWDSQFKLYCNNGPFYKKYFKLISQQCYFVGSAVFPIFMSSLSDSLGRMFALNIEMILALISVVLMVIPNEWTIIVGMFMNGGIIQIYSIISQIVTEYYDPSLRGFIFGIFMAAIPIIAILHIAIFKIVKDVQFFYYFFIISQALSILTLVLLYIESPTWLMSKGKVDKCLYYLEKASKINKTQTELEEFKLIYQQFIPHEEEEEKKKEYTMLDTYKYKSTRKWVLLITPPWMAILLFDFVVFLNVDQFGGDTYIQGISIFVACLISAFVSGVLADKFGRKIVIIIFTAFAAGVFILSPVFNQKGWVEAEMAVVFISCFCIESGFTIIILIAGESFPPTIKGSGNGIIFLVSRLGAIASPFLVELLKYPQYPSSGILAAMLIPMFFFRETLGLNLPPDVEEVMEQKRLEGEEEVVKAATGIEDVEPKEGGYTKPSGTKVEDIPILPEGEVDRPSVVTS